MSDITVIVPYRQGSKPDESKFPAHTIFVNDEGKGKKYALRKGIAAVDTEYVWLTDDDVTFVSQPNLKLKDYDLLILPLKMNEGNGSLLCRLQQTEYAALQSLTLWAAEHGHAVMCSGANLIVRRQCWLDSYSDLHTNLPSGDDMFLLESMKRRRCRIGSAYEPVLTICPCLSLKQLFRQRMRWAGKAPHYTDRDILLCGIIVILANLLAWLPPVFLAKYAIDLWLICRAERFGFHLPHKAGYAFLLSLVYPPYMLICLLGGLLRQHRW